MGSYTFTWAHAASEVFVTGDFDDWQKTIKLENEDGVFKKTVELPKAKHQYKFVVDGEWLTNDSHPKEEVDGNGIYNNVLQPHDIQESDGTLSSAAPESTTAALAAAVPKEKPASDDPLPGSFPLTPPTATPSSEPQAFSVNPIPATEGLGNPVKLAPGENVPDPSTLTSNTIQSTVKDDKEPQDEQVSVAPIPTTAGAGNPIHLAPGEKVPDPSSLTSNTIASTVKTDPASYENSDALPPQLGPVVTPEAEREAKGGMFGVPPLAGNIIPESGLPNDTNAETEKDPGVTIQSAGPTSTTAALAGEVPKEPKGVPRTVTESQKEADFPPEATANANAVEEKKEVEEELKDKVPEQPAAEGGSATAKDAGAAAVGAATAAGATAAGAFATAAYSAKEQAAKTVGLNGHATATDVPETVVESQKEAHASPEASANNEAVAEKEKVESELLKEVPESNQAGEPAPVVTAPQVPEVVAESQKEAHASPEASATEEAVEEKKQVEAELLKEVEKASDAGEPAPTTTAAATETAPAPLQSPSEAPGVVAESQKEAHASPEASANKEAVEEKEKVESELLKEVPESNEAGEPAPTVTAAKTETAPGSQTAAREVPEVVASSQREAHASPEASANNEAIEEKKQVESELVKEVETKDSAVEEKSAPTVAAATTETAPVPSDNAVADSKPLERSGEPDGLNAPASKPAQAVLPQPVNDSRDVSPMTKPPTTTEQTQPTVTSGAASTTTEPKTEPKADSQAGTKTESKAAPEAPKKEDATPESSAAADKKKKRTSFFGKLKAKLRDL